MNMNSIIFFLKKSIVFKKTIIKNHIEKKPITTLFIRVLTKVPLKKVHKIKFLFHCLVLFLGLVNTTNTQNIQIREILVK